MRGHFKVISLNKFQCGRGVGLGYNVNVPIPDQVSDDDFKIIFDALILSIANEFEPEV